MSPRHHSPSKTCVDSMSRSCPDEFGKSSTQGHKHTTNAWIQFVQILVYCYRWKLACALEAHCAYFNILKDFDSHQTNHVKAEREEINYFSTSELSKEMERTPTQRSLHNETNNLKGKHHHGKTYILKGKHHMGHTLKVSTCFADFVVDKTVNDVPLEHRGIQNHRQGKQFLQFEHPRSEQRSKDFSQQVKQFFMPVPPVESGEKFGGKEGKDSSLDEECSTECSAVWHDLDHVLRFHRVQPQVYMLPSASHHPYHIEDIPWNWLKEEKWRLITFRKYHFKTTKSAILLAANGFAFLGAAAFSGLVDLVICFFCQAQHHGWKESDDIKHIHQGLKSTCPMVTGATCSNVPMPRGKASFNSIFRPCIETTPDHPSSASLVEVAPSKNAPPQVQSQGAALVTEDKAEAANAGPQDLRPKPSQVTDLDANSAFITSTTSTMSDQGERQRSDNDPTQPPHPEYMHLAESSDANTVPMDTSQAAVAPGSPTQNPPNPNPNPNPGPPVLNGAPPAQQPAETVANRDVHPETPEPPRPGENSGQQTRSYSELGIITDRPKRREYAVKVARLRSFEGWPEGHHLTKEVLSDAGFYYAGYGDCARCFYCGGGLRNWEEDDSVWVEHARWFPKCAFLQQTVGRAFVHAVAELNKDQENISYQEVLDKMGVQADYLTPKDTQLKKDAAVVAVVKLGFTENDAIEATRKLKDEGVQLSADKLLERLQADGKLVGAGMAALDSESVSTGNTLAKDLDTISSLKDQNNQLRSQTLCKICMDTEVSVVFLPCGHFVSCSECASALPDCPVCRQPLRGIVRAFIS